MTRWQMAKKLSTGVMSELEQYWYPEYSRYDHIHKQSCDTITRIAYLCGVPVVLLLKHALWLSKRGVVNIVYRLYYAKKKGEDVC